MALLPPVAIIVSTYRCEPPLRLLWLVAAMGETPGNRSPSDDLRGAAFHEAGDVVVARHLGLSVGVIEIGIDGDPAKGKAEISDDDQLSLIDQLALCAAGIEAQEMFDAPTHDVAGFGDGVKIFNLLEDIPVEQRKALRFAGYARAIEILKLHRDEVEQLADRLLRERRIAGWP